MKSIPDYMKKIKGDPSFYHNQSKHILDDKRFATCVQYANFISKFFEEHDITNWELAGVKTRFPIDEKFCGASEDKINPDHYKVGGIETFDILKAKLSPEELEGFCKGNVIKYITREKEKESFESLLKCHWYLTSLIQLRYDSLDSNKQKLYEKKLCKMSDCKES